MYQRVLVDRRFKENKDVNDSVFFEQYPNTFRETPFDPKDNLRWKEYLESRENNYSPKTGIKEVIVNWFRPRFPLSMPMHKDIEEMLLEQYPANFSREQVTTSLNNIYFRQLNKPVLSRSEKIGEALLSKAGVADSVAGNTDLKRFINSL